MLPLLQWARDSRAKHDGEGCDEDEKEFDDEFDHWVDQMRRTQEVRYGDKGLEERDSRLLRCAVSMSSSNAEQEAGAKTYRHKRKRLHPQITPLPRIAPGSILIILG